MKYKVIIVGAGISGLSAAASLAEEHGVKEILVIEANPDRIGVCSAETTNPVTPKQVFDVGAQWLNKDTMPLLKECCEKFGVDTKWQYVKGKKFLHTERGIGNYSSSIPSLPPTSLIDFQILLDKIEREASKIDLAHPEKNLPDIDLYDSMSVAYFQKQAWTQDAKDLINLFLGSVWAANSREMSALFFLYYIQSCQGCMSLAEAHGGAQQEKFVGGTMRILNGYRKQLEQLGTQIKLGQEVIEIDQSGSGVTCKTRDGTVYEADYMVMTVPPSARTKIAFFPQLPTLDQTMIDRIYFGATIKVIVVYKKAFWREKGFSGEMLCAHNDYVRYPLINCFDAVSMDQEVPALVGFICGPPSHYWAAKTKKEREAAITTQLAIYFGSEALDYLEMLEKDWTSDPFTHGCPVNMFPTGTFQMLHKKLRTPVDKVHWAGTETAVNWMGYLEGGIESGKRAAQEVKWRLESDPKWQDKAEQYIEQLSTKAQRSLPWYNTDLVNLKNILVAVILVLLAILFYFVK